MDEPWFLTIAEVLYLHDESLRRFGGLAGIREAGLVGSAQNAYWYGRGSLYDIAAAYAFHLAQAQAFVDGNKRTAAAAAIALLKVNGVGFPQDDGTLYTVMIDIAKKTLDKSGLAAVIRRLAERK